MRLLSWNLDMKFSFFEREINWSPLKWLDLFHSLAEAEIQRKLFFYAVGMYNTKIFNVHWIKINRLLEKWVGASIVIHKSPLQVQDIIFRLPLKRSRLIAFIMVEMLIWSSIVIIILLLLLLFQVNF